MFHTNRQEKFSLRKYKDGRTDSKLIGATILAAGILSMAGINTVSADVVSNGTNEPTIVSDTSKVESAKATTFTDDTDASKTFKVDAVLDGGVTEPTKANSNTGDADGNDTVNFKSEATVNYKLDSDKSLLKTETVEAGTGTVTTPYDKKGLAADTDGKDYRDSTVAKTGDAVTATTGKKDIVEANNKVYEYVRSEVEGTDKPKYDKTSFNNIEAAVSPEGMHNKLGEIDYTKTTGKVYLVEETANGQYGKFVEANGVTSDEDAVTKWKAGEATAKEFTKENVTLQEGDTVLVLDKDTYAITDTVERKSRKTGTPVTYVAVKENIYDGTSTDIWGMTYAILRENYTAIKDIGDDGVFGTADDTERNATSNGTPTRKSMDVFDLSGREDKYSKLLQKTPDLDTSTASVKDILKDVFATGYRLVDFFSSNASKPTDIEAINTVKTNLDNKVDELVNYMKENNIRVGLSNGKVGFYVNDTSADNDASKLNQFENKVNEVSTVLDALPIIDKVKTSVASKEEAGKYGAADGDLFPVTKEVTETYEFTTVGGLVVTTNTKYDRNDGHDIIWNKYPVNTESNINISNVTTNGTWGVTVSDDKSQATLTKSERTVNEWEPSDETTTDTVTVTKKEIITPIRAYKVMGEEKPVVTHYYNLKITKEEAGETTATKQGSVVIKYVTTDGKQLKSETDKDNVPLETKTIVSLYSGETKVDERTDVKTVEQNYDTTPKQYPTLVDADTGFTYEYVGLKQGSPAASGKVVEGTTEVVYEYRLVSEEEKTPSSSVVTKTGSVDVKHVVINEDGTLKTLKETEVVKDKVPVEYEDTYVTYSKGVKVSERKEKRTVTEKYDTTDKQYPTLKDETTGLVYKYVAPISDSAPAAGDVTEGEKHVIYSYTLDKQEETTPSKTVETKGSVVVKYVDANGNEIKDAENVVTDAVVKTTKTYATKSGDVVLSTRDEVTENDVNYNAAEKKVDTITKDGKKYVFRGVYEVSDKYNNVLEETGKVKEGITTVVYQYDYVIPVDPTKPNEGENTPPKPDDKIPNDPQNRSYKDLGLLTEVKRNITYVYENGPKAGQEASEPVEQTARFTRTAEINSRTGEVTYTSDWTPEQTLAEVVSPKIDKYVVDKEKVAELPVTHESEDSSEIVKYRENPDVIEHDAAKDKKGSVVVKYVDAQGNEIDTPITIKDNVVVEKATTKVYADREETTYTPTNEEYSTVANRKDVIEVSGKRYKYSGVYEASDKFNNTTEETGKVKVGTTTVVYQYDYLIPVDPSKPNEGENTPPKPEDKIPNDPKGRTYKDLGLLTEVKRNITYVYENGPKAGQEASAPVEQTVRFTRTAEINSRTGEVVYTSDWTPEQTLAEVVSPEIKDYTVDKAKVDELTVTHESKDSAVVVKYSQVSSVSKRDYAKDKKGTVIVKFVDINENFLADDLVAKNNVIVAEATTTMTGDKEETTYKATGEEYAVTPPETIEVDGVTFRLKRVLPAGDKFKNTVEEKGLVKEGVTTIVYQYVMQIDAPKVEVPEFDGGVVPLDPPTVEKPELKIPEQPTPAPTPKPESKPEPKPETPQAVTPADNGDNNGNNNGTPTTPAQPAAPSTPQYMDGQRELPNTGTEDNANLAALGLLGVLSGFGLVARKKKED
ncbi:SIALI-17 repeat-containing surface protein [Streptococcus vestibularis]|uniref:SIALI-17 repeat-containing surface protein n=1 Tax=Streptococcus vestibularis TaxID=1343 RepID=UPI000E443761|nr:SIALI-17 repeat-containing surface protein [Streptococcus vestibularis]RGM51012.1 LPXTG cell wall anchor domain-containing protein [Streptococcus vestibularis]